MSRYAIPAGFRGIFAALSGLLLAVALPVQAQGLDSDRLFAILRASGMQGEAVIDDGASQIHFEQPGGLNNIRWRWASVTKQVVAVLVMQEVAAGRIALDAPVSRYLRDFASPLAAKVTVRQLLQHRSGLPNPDDTAPTADAFPAYYLQGYAGSRDPLRGYCAGAPKGQPGAAWSYNNCDYIVLGALLEHVTSKRWAELVRIRIAEPLGLTTVGAFPTDEAVRLALFEGKGEPRIDMASYGAAAGLYGSAIDLAKFDRALLNGKLLDAPALAELWKGDPALGYMALGQWVFDAPLKGCAKPMRIVERRGEIGGVGVRNLILPDRGIVVVLLSNQGPFEFGEIWQGKGVSYDVLSAAACSGSAP